VGPLVKGVSVEVAKDAVGLHDERDAEPPLGLPQHRRISQPLIGGHPHQGGGQVSQHLDQLHVDLVGSDGRR
jgi:hypothetical protein